MEPTPRHYQLIAVHVAQGGCGCFLEVCYNLCRLLECLLTITFFPTLLIRDRELHVRLLCYVSLPIHTMFPRFPVLPFPPLEFWSCVFRSCDFHPCDLVPRFPVPRFPFPRFQSPLFMTTRLKQRRLFSVTTVEDWSLDVLRIVCGTSTSGCSVCVQNNNDSGSRDIKNFFACCRPLHTTDPIPLVMPTCCS